MFLAVLAAVLVSRDVAATAVRPNILFIAVDDLRPQLGCYGETWMKTPQIDRLAAEGVRFDRHYVQYSVCIPSRTALLTSLRSERTRQTHSRLIWHETPGARGIGSWFTEQGYRTVSLGKIWHVPDGKNADAFEVRDALHQTEYQLPENAGLSGYGDDRRVRGRMAPVGEGADAPEENYRDAKIALAAIKQLQVAKEDGRPFLLAVGFAKPHLPFVCPKKYWDLYDPAKLPLPPQPNFPELAPILARNTGLPEYRDLPEGSGGNAVYGEASTRHLIHGYAACTSFVDAQIGRVLEALTTLGLAENTIVVLWGDHGWFLGDLQQWHKRGNFERAARSPLIVRGPGIARGAACERLVETVDIFPTLLELAGLKPLPLSDGLSFKPLLTDPVQPWKDGVYHLMDRGKIMGYAVRTEHARYVEWHEGWGLETPIVAREFYRYTAAQPDEVRNEVDDPAQAEPVARHARLLRRLTF